MNNFILFFCWIAFFIVVPNLSALEVSRIYPSNKVVKSNLENTIKFRVSASDPEGLAYSEWFVDGNLVSKNILTGYFTDDNFEYYCKSQGSFAVSAFVYNIENESEVVIWRLNVEGSPAKPSVIYQNPSERYIDLKVGEGATFDVKVEDDNCELDYAIWHTYNGEEFRSKLNGNSYYSDWYEVFQQPGDFEVCVQAFNKCGGMTENCWRIRVSDYDYEKKYFAKNEENTNLNGSGRGGFRSRKKYGLPVLSIGLFGGYFITSVEDFSSTYQDNGGFIYGAEVSVPVIKLKKTQMFSVDGGFFRFRKDGEYLTGAGESVSANWDQVFVNGGIQYDFILRNRIFFWLGAGVSYSFINVESKSASENKNLTESNVGGYGSIGSSYLFHKNIGIYLNARYDYLQNNNGQLGGFLIYGGVRFLIY